MGTLVFQANLGGAVNLIGPNTASTVNFTLPSADGTSGQALVTNGSGTLSFSTFTSGAAGSNTQVQFNSSGAFAGSANLTFDGTTLTSNALTVTNATTLSAGTANGVAYLNGSKVVTTGSALVFDGTALGVGGAPVNNRQITAKTAGQTDISIVAGSTNYAQLLFGYTGADNKGIISYYNVDNSMAFYTNASEQMRLTSTGLGIGTSSPGTKLHVTGSNGLFVQFLNSANNTGEGLVFGSGSNLGRMSTNGANTAMAFEINAVERMRLDSSGNLGLGVTPSAWNAGSPVIQMAGGTSIYADSNQTVYGLNAAYISGWKYVLSDYATQYNQVNGQHQWYIAPSGTAGNAITFTQAMTLDASGNLGLGTTSPKANSGYATLTLNNATNGGVVQFTQADTTIGQLFFDGNGGTLRTVSNTSMVFGTNNTERARIDSSGNLLVGKTSTSQSTGGSILYGGGTNGAYFTGVGSQAVYVNRETSDGTVIDIRRAASTVGTISVTTTATAYNTSSDYRLKNVTGPLTGYKERLMSLQPKQGTWIADGTEFRGFLAHEFAVPYRASVSGEKDAVDQNGKPIIQGMQASTSEVMADLIAMVKDLVTENESLRARVAQLESN